MQQSRQQSAGKKHWQADLVKGKLSTDSEESRLTSHRCYRQICHHRGALGSHRRGLKLTSCQRGKPRTCKRNRSLEARHRHYCDQECCGLTGREARACGRGGKDERRGIGAYNLGQDRRNARCEIRIATVAPRYRVRARAERGRGETRRSGGIELYGNGWTAVIRKNHLSPLKSATATPPRPGTA